MTDVRIRTKDVSKIDHRPGEGVFVKSSFEGEVGDEKTYTLVSSPMPSDIQQPKRLIQTSFPQCFAQPPPEILHMIFERTIPPHFLMDPSAITSPMSLWSKVSRQKKSLINVCRTCYQVGLRFLYEDVVIFYVPQFLRLLRTLDVPNTDIGHLIKSISFYCQIPRENQLTFETKLKPFLSLCPNATSFIFQPPIEDDYWSFWNTLSFNITHLSVDNVDIDLSMRMVRISASSLISLCLGPFLYRFRNSDLEDQDLCLPCLEDLSTTGSGYLRLNFTMPRLKRLTILQYHEIESGSDFLSNILRRHGSTLKFLHISPKLKRILLPESLYQMPPAANDDLQDLLDPCPSLEHIVLHSRVTGQLTHENVKWVDVWEPIQYEPSPCEYSDYISDWWALRRSITKHAFPSLRAVRQISSAFYSFQNLPTFFPPGQVLTASDSFACTFLDMDVHHDVGRIYGHISPLTINWPDGYTSNTPFSFFSHDEPVEYSDESDGSDFEMLEREDAESNVDSSLEDGDDSNIDSDYLENFTDQSSDSDLSEGSNSIDWRVTPGERLVTITDLDWREFLADD